MSDFEVRPVGRYRAPAYPAAPEVGAAPQAPMIANKLSKLAPLALILAPMTARASASTPVVMVDAPPRDAKPPVAVDVPQTAVDALIGIAAQDTPPVLEGKVAARSRTFTEAEIAAAVKDVLTDLGIKADGAMISRDGVKMRVAAIRGESVVAVVEALTKPAQEELMILRARGEMKVLLLTAGDLEYEIHPGSSSGRVPTRDVIVRRLRAQLESFFK